MKEIQLTQGKVALVDDQDYEWLNQWKWCIKSGRHTDYAVRANLINGRKGLTYMHREIIGVADRKAHIDHINRNGLDNRRDNIRQCTCSENLRNRGASATSKTGIKGVSPDRHGKFLSTLKVEGKSVYVGYFATIDEAAAAYNEAAIKYHGEFANLNTI